MIPGYWVCGGGSSIDCEYWDDVNGCWQDQSDVDFCRKARDIQHEQDAEDEET